MECRTCGERANINGRCACYAAGLEEGMDRRNNHELYLSGARAERERIDAIIEGWSGVEDTNALRAAIREGE